MSMLLRLTSEATDIEADKDAIALLRDRQEQCGRADFEVYYKLDRIINHLAERSLWQNLG